MKNKLFLPLALLAFVFCCFTSTAYAQKKPATTARQGVSAADQKAIIELFKGVDQSKYRIQFNNRKNVYGSRKIEMRDVQQIKRVNNPAELAGWIVFVVEGDDVVYVLAVGSSDLVSVIGKEKAQKLNAIMAKYR